MTTAAATGNTLRIIMDELLVGNKLEEIQCRASGRQRRVRRRCRSARRPTTSRAARSPRTCCRRRCPGDARVCICQLDGGCPSSTHDHRRRRASRSACSTSTRTAPPTTRSFIAGAVGIKCGADRRADRSRRRATGTRRATSRSPARVASTRSARRSCSCPRAAAADEPRLRPDVRADVVDKDGQPGLRAARRRHGTASRLHARVTPAAFQFTTEPLSLDRSPPGDGDTGRRRTDAIAIGANAPLDATTIATITITRARRRSPRSRSRSRHGSTNDRHHARPRAGSRGDHDVHDHVPDDGDRHVRPGRARSRSPFTFTTGA